ncbi:MAG TPA: MoaD family protein [Steroidobacteraceae bacterium]|nr:MoaD family protein [Steroidobacteraceae bacterium]
MTAPLYGLVLAGGRSSRMQRDKATLAYHGGTQLECAMALVGAHVERAFVSVRADQTGDPVRARFAQIVDRRADLGPIAGIAAAQAEHPHAAWLVIACDLPFLDSSTVKHLVWARQAGRQATAYRSSHDGLPEPLCAIYEPASREAIEAYVQAGGRCPRKFLVQADAALLDEPNPRALDNINTPEEYRAVVDALSGVNRHIRVQYYAVLREQAGRSEETLETAAGTPGELYAELRARYPFSLAPEMLRVAVNAEFADWGQPLADGDAVVFIPPVAGG